MAFSSRPSSKIYDKNLIFYHITAYCELIWQIEKSASSPPKYLRFSGCNDLWIFHIAKLTSKSAFSRKFQLLGQTLWVGIKLVFLSARRPVDVASLNTHELQRRLQALEQRVVGIAFVLAFHRAGGLCADTEEHRKCLCGSD